MTYAEYDKICAVVSHISSATATIMCLNMPGFDSAYSKKTAEHIAELLLDKPYIGEPKLNTEFANRLKSLLKEYLSEQQKEFENL